MDIRLRAIQYPEKYGIIDYKVKNGILVYYKNYPAYLSNKAYTVKTEVNLNTMNEIKKQLKRYRNIVTYN